MLGNTLRHKAFLLFAGRKFSRRKLRKSCRLKCKKILAFKEQTNGGQVELRAIHSGVQGGQLPPPGKLIFFF